MLEERARILSVGSHSVWVEANRQQDCAKCEAGEGCGGGVLGKLVKRRASRLEVFCDLQNLHPGDSIVVGFDEQALLRISLIAYLLPLFCMFVAALMAHYLFNGSDVLVAMSGALGLASGFLVFHQFGKSSRRGAHYQPRVLRRINAATEGCQVYMPKSNRE